MPASPAPDASSYRQVPTILGSTGPESRMVRNPAISFKHRVALASWTVLSPSSDQPSGIADAEPEGIGALSAGACAVALASPARMTEAARNGIANRIAPPFDGRSVGVRSPEA